MRVHFIDTSVFVYFIGIPGMTGNKITEKKLHDELKRITEGKGDCLVLPYATLIETGNHIAHCKDGNVRRMLAQKFSEVIHKTINNEMPWQYYGKQLTEEDLEIICTKFPDAAMQGEGFGDLSIIRAYERYRDETPAVSEIRIWSLDQHLSDYSEKLQNIVTRN